MKTVILMPINFAPFSVVLWVLVTTAEHDAGLLQDLDVPKGHAAES